jgi:hypothetical protein
VSKVSTAIFAARAAGNSIEKHKTIRILCARTDADPLVSAGGENAARARSRSREWESSRRGE